MKMQVVLTCDHELMERVMNILAESLSAGSGYIQHFDWLELDLPATALLKDNRSGGYLRASINLEGS